VLTEPIDGPLEEAIEEPTEGRIKRYFKKHRRKLLIVFLLHIIIGGTIAGLQFIQTQKLPVNLPGIVASLGIEPHFLFNIEGIARPSAVAVSIDAERVYVAESGGTRMIHMFDYSGKRIGAFVPPGSTPSTRAPVGVAVNKFGQVYVADSFRKTISVYSYDGEFIETFWPSAEPGYQWMPVSMTFDGDDNLYVADQQYPLHQIHVFDRDGNLKARFGYFGIGDGMLAYPTDVLVDDDGNIYVADSTNTRLQVFDAEGNFLRKLMGFDLPHSLGFDTSGRLHVVDSMAHQVAVFQLDAEAPPQLEYTYGSLGIERGQFYFPADVALDGTGRIYVADQFSDRIQVWSY
jgi:DNA-binding beta-propeller fold protein YncE